MIGYCRCECGFRMPNPQGSECPKCPKCGKQMYPEAEETILEG